MRLKTFGETKLEGTDLSRPKVLLLLTYLVLEGKKPRRYLAELFYSQTKNKFDGLTQGLKQLKKYLNEDQVTIDRTNAQAHIESDVTSFLNALDKQQYETAINTYQGAFLADINLKLELELEEWLYGMREYLALRAREAFLHVAEQEYQQDNLSKAASLAEKAYDLSEEQGLKLEPDQFQRIYTLLEANNSPKAKLVKEEAEGYDIVVKFEEKSKLENQDLPETPNNLPTAKTSFIGRDQDLMSIAKQLSQDECKLLTLHGMGGIGKTRLALQAANEQLLLGTFKDGIYFIALDSINSSNEILSAITTALNVPLQGKNDIQTQLTDYIADKKLLLILDNYEHVIDAATLPAELLDTCTNIKIIITSREVLRLEEEWVKPLEGLSYPEKEITSQQEVQNYEAYTLFKQRAQQTKLGFTLNQNNLSSLHKLCKLVQGVPLAIELSATWIRSMSLPDILQEIENQLKTLDSQNRKELKRHESLHMVFEQSWKLLTPKEQQVLARLSVFPTGFTYKAAKQVADASRSNLVGLMNKAMLNLSENARYTKHPLIHQLTIEQLNKKDKKNTLSKMRNYYLDFLDELSKRLISQDQKSLLEELENEFQNIQVVWMSLFKGATSKDTCAIINAICEFITIRGKLQEGITMFKDTRKRLYSLQGLTLEKAVLNRCLAWMSIDLNKIQGAMAYIQESFDHLESMIEADKSLTYWREKAQVLKLQGNMYVRDSDYSKAKICFDEELYIYMKINDEVSRSATLNNLGYLNTSLGNYVEAERQLKEGYEINYRLKRKSPMAVLLETLGNLYLATERFKEAEKLFQESVRLAREINFKSFLPLSLLGLGKAEFLQGKDKDAEMCFHEALIVSKESNNVTSEIECYVCLAELALSNCKLDFVQNYLSISLRLELELEFNVHLLNILAVSEKLLMYLGEDTLARRINEIQASANRNDSHYKKLKKFQREATDDPKFYQLDTTFYNLLNSVLINKKHNPIFS